MARDARPEELPSQDYRSLSLYDYIPAISPDYKPPYHLGEYVDLLEHMADGLSDPDRGNIRVCVAMPPQHTKTTTALHAIAQKILQFPKLKVGYASHGQQFSEEQSRIVRELYLESGGRIKADHNKIAHWQTEQGGGLIATSWEGSLIGRKLNVLFCDDLIKDARMAESPEQREHIWRWLNGVAKQRMWPGASVFVVGSRWHYDDPSGRLIASGYRELCLPAIRQDEDGVEHALWPDVKPIKWLNRLRDPNSPDFVGEHEWWAAYQGKPRPRTGALFGPATMYTDLPPGATCEVLGIDIATSDGTESDFAAVVVLFFWGGIYYVHDVFFCQWEMHLVTRMIQEAREKYKTATRMATYTQGPEKGILNLLFTDYGMNIERLPARWSKFTRSQRAARAWKQGRIQVRRGQQWTGRFVREVEFFTGAEGRKDDLVDAMVSGFDCVASTAPVEWVGRGGFTFGKTFG